jgi:hypothetical protein
LVWEALAGGESSAMTIALNAEAITCEGLTREGIGLFLYSCSVFSEKA